ncbi:MAG TPA: carboxypeptidase-like regulatory domain-containing protein [Candidatus Thermoplasmatota archaeon]|nr:carboxypeptidase-like regulatory domain-containing protein [Candidatus Thermoplasmatota archaeon]
MRAAVGLAWLLLLAGCSSPASTGGGVGGGHIEQHVVDAGGAPQGGGAAGSPPKAGFGTIEGVVVDDANLTLSGAGVSLLGTQLFATSGKRGEFRFADLKADVYGIRVQATTFQVYEGKVTVHADKVTRATVVMVPLDGRGPGYRPHLHDYWGRDTQITIMDDDVDLREPTAEYATMNPAIYTAYSTAYYPNSNVSMYFHIPSGPRPDGRPPLVLPATAQMRVRITWDEAEVQVKQFGIGYSPPSASRTTFYNLHPHPSGQEWAIDLRPQDTDSGHQYFSLWRFSIWTANAFGQATTFSPSLIRGPVHIEIVLVKGEVPVDPPHTDPWNGTTSLLVRRGDQELVYSTLCLGVVCDIVVAPDKDRLVPPGTARLHLRFTWSARIQGQTPPPSPLDGEWTVSWKPASMDPNQHGPGDYVTTPPTSSGPLLKEWDLAVAPGDTDAFYQSTSNWLFRLYQPHNEGMMFSPDDYGHAFHLEVTAFKDPRFT